MKPHKTTPRIRSLAVVLLLAVLPLACGGGGGTNPTPPGISATWQPENPSPGANTISMGAGAASGANFSVPVQVTGIDNFQMARIARLAGAPMDKGAGVDLLKRVGDKVETGEPLYRIHAEFPADFQFARSLAAQELGFSIGEAADILQLFVEF